MSGIQQELLGGPFGGQYQIQRSLRFNSADSAYLNRTPASASNRKTWTWSGWVKRSGLSASTQGLFARNDGSVASYIVWNSNEKLEFASASGSVEAQVITTPVYRDVSSWYHVVVALDTTQATSSNRLKIYVNGVQVTALDTASYPSQNYDAYVNTTNTHYIGNGNPAGSLGWYSNQYLTEINFIDGQALTPSSFGETNADTGVWQPKAYTGTYGTNGFQLLFADNSGTTSTTLGKDTSGNGNNWTPNNFSVTAGVGNDSLVDTPTPYGTDTGAGGEVRGNYATLNPLDNAGLTLSNGNLQFDRAVSSWLSTRATIGMSSGKWYWEIVQTSGNIFTMLGISTNSESLTTYVGAYANGWGYYSQNGKKYNNNVDVAYGNSWTNDDVIGVSFDADNGELKFYKNGVVQNSGTAAYTGLTSGPYFPTVSQYRTGTAYINFGQRPFAYTAPSGFKALCTQNLPTPTIGATATTRADDYFNTVLYTGTGASLGVTGVGFQPDWTWIKSRSAATDHGLYDAVRGVQKQLESNNTDAETTETTGLTAFNTDGFTVGALAQLNTNTATYVGWNWKANGAGSSNTQGTITSTVSANTTAGFSIVTYTGTGANATVGHGLGAVPSMIIVKHRSTIVGGPYNWRVYHANSGNVPANEGLLALNTTAAVASSSTAWNSTSPTSTVFSIGTDPGVNSNTATYVAYCFAPVASYSSFGSFTGNGSTDGPMVFTNHRPALILVKRTDSTGNWTILDNKREGYNVDNDPLYPNLSNAEGTTDLIDIVSNGFKVRSTNTSVNANGGTYIYAAFAENPFKYSLAR